MALSHPPRGQHSQQTGCAGSIRSRSESCCVDASDSPFLCVRAPADVAASWTSMAIIEQRVRKQGFWVEEVSSWSVQQVCREAGGRVSTNVFVRDLDIADHARLDGRRLEVVADGLSWRGAQLVVTTPPRRVTPQQNAHHQWSSAGESSPQEGAHVPQTCRRGRTGSVGGRGCGGRRSLVRRDSAVSARIGQGLRPVCAVDPSGACGSRMDSTLELHLGLQRSTCFRDVPLGAPTNPWHRWRGLLGERGAPRR